MAHEKLIQKDIQNCIVPVVANKLLNLNQILFSLFRFEFRLSCNIVILQVVDFFATWTVRDIFEGGFKAVVIGNPATALGISRVALK